MSSEHKTFYLHCKRSSPSVDDNFFCSSVPTPEEVASLHHFHRDQIKLTMFLGSGAFGEVFEGLAAVTTPSDSMEWMKVAIKVSS
jgi:hypothetical protein